MLLSTGITIDKSSPIPVYHQIASDLIERISKGEWIVGDRFPPETELIQEYEVSRVTMRQALAELEQRGIIERQRGKGSFLTTNPTPFIESLNFPSPNQEKSKKNDSRVLEWKYMKEIPLYVQQMFRIRENQELIFLSRLFLRNDIPVGLNHTWFPAEMVPDLIEKGLVNKSVTDTLNQRYQYKIQKVENYIEAAKMNAQEAALLENSYDAPALKIISTHFLDSGIPIEYSNTLWVAATTRFRMIAEAN